MGALHVPESKKNAKTEGAVMVFEDEASFRQTPTLHATWAKRGSQPRIPTRGERHTQKIFGAVRLDSAGFIYLHQEDYFQWETYLAFLEQVVVPAFYRRHRIYLIQDNASYHKKQETYDWFKANRRYVEVFQLPPYWPELNAPNGSGITRASTSHTIGSLQDRRIFVTRSSGDLTTCDTIRRRSKTCSIPFFDSDVELFMRTYIVGVPVGVRPTGGACSVATVVIPDQGEGNRPAESSGVKVSVGWVTTWSDPPGRRANRQAVAKANRSIAPKTPTHRKRMMGVPSR